MDLTYYLISLMLSRYLVFMSAKTIVCILQKNIIWIIVLFVILGFCSALDWSNIMSAMSPGGALTHHRPLEFDHSFNMPFDAHGAYWTFGGMCTI